MSIAIPTSAPNLRATLNTLPSFIRLLKHVDPIRFWLVWVNGIFRGVFSWFMVYALNALGQVINMNTDKNTIFFWVAGVVLSGGLLNATQATAMIITDVYRHKLEAALYRMSLEKITKVSLGTLENANFQALFHLFKEQNKYAMDVLNASYGLIFEGFEVVGLLVGVLFFPLPVLLIILAALFIKFFLGSRVGVSSWSLFSLHSRNGKRALYYATIFQHFASAMEGRLFGFATIFIKKWQDHISTLLKQKIKVTWQTIIALGIGDIVQIGGLILGCYLILNSPGPQALASILPFIVTYQRFQYVGGQWFGDILWFFECAPFLTVLQSFEAIPEEDPSTISKQQPVFHDTDNITIEFRNVSFTYPGSTQATIKQLNVTFAAHEKLALVGSNGAGKSTFIKLLLGLYEPTTGQILINGTKLHKTLITDWQGQLSVMLQQISNYDDSLKEQIHYGAMQEPFDQKRFEKILDVSGVGSFLNTLPQGIDTHIGKEYAMPEDMAIEVSGGQRQMIAIARTLYRKARFYIFDEPTSAIDAEKEEQFFEALPETVGKSGVLFISHRFSTVRRADRILVMENGTIIEDGSHQVLLAQNGRYKDLFSKQAKMYH